MAISVFDIYKIGVGPSSSHTFGPMVAAQRFLRELQDEGAFEATAKAEVQLYGSMALTGKGHFTDLAAMLGLEGNEPATLDSASIPAKQRRIETEKTLHLAGKTYLPFDAATDIHWHGEHVYETHPNGIAFRALAADGAELKRGLYFSIGGGFIVCEKESLNPKDAVGDVAKPFPYTTADALRALCEREGVPISEIVRRGLVAVGGVDEFEAGDVDGLRLRHALDALARTDEDRVDDPHARGVGGSGERRLIAGMGDRGGDRRNRSIRLDEALVSEPLQIRHGPPGPHSALGARIARQGRQHGASECDGARARVVWQVRPRRASCCRTSQTRWRAKASSTPSMSAIAGPQ